MSPAKMTQVQMDYEVVKGWRDAARAAREDSMIAFYERLLARLQEGAPASDPTWVRFDTTGPSESGKTLTWSVRTLEGNGYLGRVAWFGRWRRYGFFPDEGTVFEHQCLRDIAAFCEQETAAQRTAKAVGA